MRFRIAFVMLIVGLALFSTTSLVSGGSSGVSGGCAATYTVQWGDTLYSIARRHNTTVSQMMVLNVGRIVYPSRIYAGQVICVPGQPEPTTRSQVALEATYQYTPTADETESGLITARGGFIGKRMVFPQQAINPVEIVTTPLQVASAIIGTPPAVLVGVRNDDDTYTLVTVGREDILSSLRISGTVPLSSECFGGLDVKEALGDEAVKQVSVTLGLEAENSLRYPFSITRVDALTDAITLQRCYTGPGKDEKIGFALFPADSGRANEYRVLIVFDQGVFGPPGTPPAQRCNTWARFRGVFYRWLRSWYGCR